MLRAELEVLRQQNLELAARLRAAADGRLPSGGKSCGGGVGVATAEAGALARAEGGAAAVSADARLLGPEEVEAMALSSCWLAHYWVSRAAAACAAGRSSNRAVLCLGHGPRGFVPAQDQPAMAWQPALC
jgi:hypothetical protein